MAAIDTPAQVRTADGVPITAGSSMYVIDINEAGPGKDVYPAEVLTVHGPGRVFLRIGGYRIIHGYRPAREIYALHANAVAAISNRNSL